MRFLGIETRKCFAGLKPSPFVARLLLNIKKYEDESINFKKKLEDQLKEQKREHNENQRMKEEVKDLQYRIIELMNENHRLKEGINEKNTQFQDLEDYMMESKIEKLKNKVMKMLEKDSTISKKKRKINVRERE